MTIQITDSNRIDYDIELERQGDTNDNGTEYTFYGESEDNKGNPLTVQAFQNRTEPFVLPESVELSPNITTTQKNIANQINSLIEEI